MREKDEQLIDDIINNVLRSSPGIRYVILMDRTGLTISFEIKFKTDKSVYIERLGAISGAVFQAVEEQGEMVDYGNTISQITEYEKGFIFSMSTGEGILCVITDKNINMGFVRNMMLKHKETLSKTLARYLNQDTNEITEELKSLFSENQADFI